MLIFKSIVSVKNKLEMIKSSGLRVNLSFHCAGGGFWKGKYAENDKSMFKQRQWI